MFIEIFNRTFRSFRHRNYRLFFVGQGISVIGTWMQRIAVSWLVYRLTDSAYMLGIASFASQIPTFLLAPVGGLFADKFNKYRLLLLSQVLSMVQALLLAFFTLRGHITVLQVILLSTMLGIINAFDVPIRQSFTLEMVENENKDLVNAIALNSSLFNVARLLGPSIAGILIASVGEGFCFLANGLSYVAVIICLLLMKFPARIKVDRSEGQNKNIFKEFSEGFAYAFNTKKIRSVILFLALVSFVAMPYQVLMPVFAKQVLHGSSDTLGFLMAAAGGGALIGALYLASRRRGTAFLKMIAVSGFIFGGGLIVLSFSRNFVLSFIILIIVGFGMLVQMGACNTFLQTTVEDSKRGRIMAFYTMAFMGTAPFGGLLAGLLGGLMGVSTTLLLGGICCIIGSIFFMRDKKSSLDIKV